MKLKLFSVLALGGLLSAAFACGDSSGDGGSGGSGGSGGDTTSSTTKSTSSSTKATTGGMTTTTGMNTTTTGMGMCDDGTAGTIDSQICTDCIICTQTGNCSAEWQAYANDPNYDAYLACNQACAADDDACFQACSDMYPDTDDAFIAAASCSICGECPNNCDAANVCM
ncbi:MAG: hypothetical protein JNL21_20470 [Myxococcales bacterium]|nr:hypothetical protein [Myxococcales bacterium]